MTREEAIEMLKNTIAYESNFAEAKRMAIEALKGGDAEVNETKSPYMQHSPIIGADLISRANAIEAVCKAVCEDDVSIFPECDQIKYCDEIQALLALPSAEAEWIESRYVCTCSRCGYLVELKTPFCPNCGVKMKGEFK